MLGASAAGVTAAANKLIEMGVADSARLGVHGTSYGGYATNLLITQTQRFKAATTIDAAGQVVMPGLINAHTHTPMTLFRGHVEGHSLFTMEGWYNTIRVLELEMEPQMLPGAVAVSCAEMIRTGTVRFFDMYWHAGETARAVADLERSLRELEIGMPVARAALGRAPRRLREQPCPSKTASATRSG